MSRLTKKDYKDWLYLTGTILNEKASNHLNEINHKLGKLEDLEDELGCSLEIVINLIKNSNKLDKEDRTQDIYFDYKGQLIEASFLTLGFEYNECVFYVQTSLPDSDYDFETMTLKVKNYGKTWFLNKNKE